MGERSGVPEAHAERPPAAAYGCGGREGLAEWWIQGLVRDAVERKKLKPSRGNEAWQSKKRWLFES